LHCVSHFLDCFFTVILFFFHKCCLQFCHVPKWKFEINRSRCTWVMIEQKTDRQTDIYIRNILFIISEISKCCLKICVYWNSLQQIWLKGHYLLIPFISGNIYLSIYLIIQLELWILESALSVNGNIYFYWNYSDTKEILFLTSFYIKACLAPLDLVRKKCKYI